MTDKDIDEFLERLLTVCRVISGARQAHGSVPADPDDEAIIAAALEADADYIVSEDKHLLTLQNYQDVRILSRVEFATELDRLSVLAE